MANEVEYVVVPPARSVYAWPLAFFITFLIAIAAYFYDVRPLAQAHRLATAERRAQDALVRLRPKPAPHPLVAEVALNNVRRQMVDAEGRPLGGRSVYGSLIRRLAADGAKVIVLDVYLPDRTTRAQDGALWRAMADTARVFLPIRYDPAKSNLLSAADLLNQRELEYSVLHSTRTTTEPNAPRESWTWWKFVPPVYDFTRNAGGGHTAGVGLALTDVDEDGVLREIWYGRLTDLAYPQGAPPSNLQLKGATEELVVPSEVVAPVARMLEVSKPLIGVHFGQYLQYSANLGQPLVLPMDEWGRAALPLFGAPGLIPTYNAADVIDGKTAAGTFRGKLVVLGVDGPFPSADNARTAFSPSHPRMDVTAQTISAILSRRPLYRMERSSFWPIAIAAIIAGLAIPAPRRWWQQVLMALGLYVAAWVIAVLVAGSGTLLPIFAMAVTIWGGLVISLLLSWGFGRSAETETVSLPPA